MNSTNGFALIDVIDTSASSLLTPNENDFKLFVFQFELYRQGLQNKFIILRQILIHFTFTFITPAYPNPSKCALPKFVIYP
jgi:hypothetical protein